MTTVTLHEGDNRITLCRLIDAGVRVHSVVTDPPYGLTSISKRFGQEGAAPAKFGTDGAFARASAGFMGSKWDGTGIERDPEFWRLIWEILLPGGYVVAFSGSRTGHWQACAMETAGFIMHPFLGWVFGQGFPKAHSAAMAIDKQLGVEPGFVPEGDPVKRMIPGAQQRATGDWIKTDDRAYQPGRRVPGSPEAQQWDGWAYGGQALKPALEPIYVGQKPFSEKNGALNLLKHGVGAINIDGCRVPTTDNLNGGAYAEVGGRTESQSLHAGSGMNVAGKTVGREFMQPTGRHPANLLHDGSAEVVALFPQTSSGTGAVKRRSAAENNGNTGSAYGAESRPAGAEMVAYGDSGSAARFFNAFPPDADPVFYHGKATKGDRVYACTGCGKREVGKSPIDCGCEDTKRSHPTVKPIALMRWLVWLVTPNGGTVLDPFAGSGTTGAAARAEGFDCVLMEAEAQFADDIRARFDLPRPLIHQFSDFDDLLGGEDVPELEDILG